MNIQFQLVWREERLFFPLRSPPARGLYELSTGDGGDQPFLADTWNLELETSQQLDTVSLTLLIFLDSWIL